MLKYKIFIGLNIFVVVLGYFVENVIFECELFVEKFVIMMKVSEK